MAAVVASTSTPFASDTFDNSDKTITLPSGIANGDLILVLFCTSADSTIAVAAGSSAGWTISDINESTNQWTRWVWKFADTTEALVMSTSASVRHAYAAYRISGAESIEFGTSSEGYNSTPTPPAFSPAGGSKEYLWVVGASNKNAGMLINAAPSGYENWSNVIPPSSAGVGASIATKTATAATETPGAFGTNGVTQYWTAHTAAVTPAGASAVKGRSLLLGVG